MSNNNNQTNLIIEENRGEGGEETSTITDSSLNVFSLPYINSAPLQHQNTACKDNWKINTVKPVIDKKTTAVVYTPDLHFTGDPGSCLAADGSCCSAVPDLHLFRWHAPRGEAIRSCLRVNPEAARY